MSNRKQIGTFHYNKNGLGYVLLDDDEREGVISLVPSARDGVFDGDTVEVVYPYEQHAPGEPRILRGRVLRVVRRRQDHVVGTLFSDDEGREYIKPVSYIPYRVKVQKSDFGSFEEGDLVKAKISPAKTVSALRLSPIRSYGKADTFEAAMAMLFDGSSFGESFSQDAMLQSRELVRDGSINDRTDRRTFDAGLFAPVRSLTGSSDVAYCVDITDEATTVYIHLIDIDDFIPAGSPLDTEAATRFRAIRGMTASKYSLLPVNLIGTVFNLVAPGEHPAITLKMVLSPSGSILDFDVEKSIVSNITPITYDNVERCASPANASLPEGAICEYDTVIKHLASLSRALMRSRTEHSGVAVKPRFVRFFEESPDAPDHLDAGFDSEFVFFELLIAAGHALVTHFYMRREVTGLYSYCELPTFLPGIDIPLYYKPLEPFCDIYSKTRLAEAAYVSRNTTACDVVASCVNLLAPPPIYTITPTANPYLGLSCYAPVGSPTACYDALVQQRAIKAALDGRRCSFNDVIDEYNKQSLASVQLDRTLRILLGCRYYSKKTAVYVTVICPDNPCVVCTDGGIVGELSVPSTSLRRFSEGQKIKARIKSVSFDKRNIVFTL